MKRLLLITYYFPPCGGAGVQRWLRLIPYLLENGWIPTIITTDKGDYPVSDETLCRKIPSQIQVIRTKTPVFGKIFSTFTGNKEGLPHGSLQASVNASLLTRLGYWARINLIAPDVRRIWNKFAYKAAIKELRNRKYDLVITTGPPHSTHLVGLKLKNRCAVKWVTDFRDPWTEINYLQLVKQNRLIIAINKKLERDVVRNADLNLIVSETIAASLPQGRKKVLYNGFDPRDFEDIFDKNRDTQLLSTPFRIKYVGVIRRGHPLNEALILLNEVAEQGIIKDIELSFVGSFSDQCVPQHSSLKIRNIRHTSHKEALMEMVTADVLLLLIRKSPDNKGVLTTKLFEYIASAAFIIGIGPTDGEAAEILRRTKSGVMVDYADKNAFIETLKKVSEREFTANKITSAEFSAPEQAKDLSETFNKLI